MHLLDNVLAKMKILLDVPVMKHHQDIMISPLPKVWNLKDYPIYSTFFFILLIIIFFLLECECNEDGSVNELCDEASGKCTCKENVIGDKCTQCATEFWGLISNCEGKL